MGRVQAHPSSATSKAPGATPAASAKIQVDAIGTHANEAYRWYRARLLVGDLAQMAHGEVQPVDGGVLGRARPGLTQGCGSGRTRRRSSPRDGAVMRAIRRRRRSERAMTASSEQAEATDNDGGQFVVSSVLSKLVRKRGGWFDTVLFALGMVPGIVPERGSGDGRGVGRHGRARRGDHSLRLVLCAVCGTVAKLSATQGVVSVTEPKLGWRRQGGQKPGKEVRGGPMSQGLGLVQAPAEMTMVAKLASGIVSVQPG